MQRSLEPKNGKDRQPPDRGELPVPTNPVIMATLRAIYAGGSKPRWQSNSFGRPYYRHEARDGKISLFFESPPNFKSLFNPYYISTPRMDFVYSGKLRQIVSRLSVETADVFLILISRADGEDGKRLHRGVHPHLVLGEDVGEAAGQDDPRLVCVGAGRGVTLRNA